MTNFTLYRPKKPSRFAAMVRALDGSKPYIYSHPASLQGLDVPSRAAGRISCDLLFLIARRIEALSSGKQRMVTHGAIATDVGTHSLRMVSTYRTKARLVSAIDLDEILSFSRNSSTRMPSIRDSLTWVDGATFQDAWLVPPPVAHIASLLADLREFLGRELGCACPTQIAQMFLFQFTHIHPLSDGNGRFARLWMSALSLASQDSGGLALSLMLLEDRRQFGRAWSGDTGAISKLQVDAARTSTALVRLGQLTEQVLRLYPDSKPWRTLVVSTCCFGRFSEETIRAIDRTGASLAGKILTTATNTLNLHRERNEECPINRLIACIDELNTPTGIE